MRIILYGYYGHGELCDDFLADATRKTVEKISGDVQWVSPGYDADLVVLGGGSLLGENAVIDELCALLRSTDIPFAIFGTGVRDTAPGPFVDTLKYLWQRARSISVRGETSRQRLRDWGLDVGKIQTLGDPIFLTEPLGLEKKGYIGGVVRPTPTSYPGHMKASLDYLSRRRKEPVRLFSFCDAQLDDVSNRQTGYESHSLDAAGTRRAIAESSFWYGNRLHAFCLALLEGTPAIGVEIEFQKVEDVCSTLSYPFWTLPRSDIKTVYDNLLAHWMNLYVQTEISRMGWNLTAQLTDIMRGV
jgi:polysaccharide pyruvyl transferase WcaK-like protein